MLEAAPLCSLRAGVLFVVSTPLSSGICMFAHSNPQTEITERNVYVTSGVCSPPPRALRPSHSRCTAETFLTAGAKRKLIERRFSLDHPRELAAGPIPKDYLRGKSRESRPEFQAKPLVIAGPVARIAKSIGPHGRVGALQTRECFT